MIDQELIHGNVFFCLHEKCKKNCYYCVASEKRSTKDYHHNRTKGLQLTV